MFRIGAKGVLILVGAILGIAAISVGCLYLFGGIGRVTADFRGENEKIELTKADGKFRIATYEEFFNLCASVQNAEGQVKALEEELETGPSEWRKGQIQSSITALKNQRVAAVNDYNSKAAQEHRGDFKAASLPAKLFTTTEETQCTV